MFMQETWTKKWQNALIWACGYLSIVAFVLVAGWAILKSEDEELKKTAKKAFFIVLIFAAISALLALFNACAGIFDSYYGSSAYDFYTIASKIITIAEIITFAVFIVLNFAGAKQAKTVEASASTAKAETKTNKKAETKAEAKASAEVEVEGTATKVEEDKA